MYTHIWQLVLQWKKDIFRDCTTKIKFYNQIHIFT